MLQRASVNVHIKPVPFEAGHDCLVRPGRSIAAIVEGKFSEILTMPDENVVCRLDGDMIPRAHWDFVFPDGGQVLFVSVQPSGDVFNAAATVGIMIASAYTGGLAAAAWGAWAGAAVATGTAITGYVAKNALIPQQQPDLSMRSGSAEDMSAHLSISGTSNTARKHGRIARVFGKVRRYPDLAARWYTEVAPNGDIYARGLLDWGYSPTESPLEASDFKIGETDLSEFDFVEMEHSSLIVGDTHHPERDLTLYPSAVNETQIGVDVKGLDPVTNEGGDWDVRTGTIDTDETVLILNFPSGLYSAGQSLSAASVTFEAQWAPKGTQDWNNFNEVRGEESDKAWVKTFVAKSEADSAITVTAKYKANRQLEFRAKHPQRGQYDYRMRRTTNASGDSVQDTIKWVSVRCITAKPPVDREGMPPVARTVLYLKADGEMSGVVDQFNAIIKARKPVYDPDTDQWGTQYTRNCAWAMVDVMHSEVSGYPVPYDKIDVDEFLDLAQRCEERKWYFDAVIDFDCSGRQLFNYIAAVCRTDLLQRGPLWSVVQDKPRIVVRHLFSCKNGWKFELKRTRTRSVNCLRSRFNNAELDFKEDEILTYEDGFSKDGADGTQVATTFEDDQVFGVTAPKHVQEIGVWKKERPKLRPEEWKYTVGRDGYEVERGDACEVRAVEVSLGGAEGYLKAVNTEIVNPGTPEEEIRFVSVVTDEPCRMEAGKVYGIDIRLAGRTKERKRVVTNPNDSHVLVFADEITGQPQSLPFGVGLKEDLLFHFGEAGTVSELMVVKSIDYHEGKTATLTFEHAANALHDADADLPPWSPSITNPIKDNKVAPLAPVIESVTSDKTVAAGGADGVPAYRMHVRVRAANPNAKLSGFQIQYRETDGDWIPRPDLVGVSEALIPQLSANESYDVRVRAVSIESVASPWTTQTGILIDTGSWDNPSAPVVTHSIRGEMVVLSWQDCRTDLPIREYVVDSIPCGPGLTLAERIAWSGAKTWQIKAVDAAGNESAVTEYTLSVDALPVALALACQGLTRSIKVVVSGDITSTLDGFEVWAAPTNDREQAAPMGMTDGDNIFTHPGLDLVDTRYYWCRARDIYGTTGEWYPVGQYGGVRGDTDPTPMDLPDHSIDESKLVRELTGITGDIALEPDIVEHGTVIESVADVKPLDIRMTAAENSWTLKLTRGNKVAGMGLLLDENARSEFAVLADKFCLAVDDDGELIFPFVANADGVNIRGDLIATGAIVAAKLAAGAVTGDKIHSQSDISVGNGGMFRAEDGSFAVVTSGGETVFAMGDEGTVDSKGGISSLKNYVKFTGRDIEFRRYLEGAQRLYKSLKRFEIGWAENGQWVDLPGFWEAEPKIQLSPRNLTCFDKTSPTVDQALNMEVVDVRIKDGHTHVYEFKANARLVIAAGTSDFMVGLSDAESSDAGTAQTAAYTTPAYCTAATVSYRIKAVKPTGTVNEFKRRSVLIKVFVDGTQKASKVVDVGENVEFLSGTISVSGLTSSASGHDIYLTATASDVTGTFMTGDVVYDYPEPPPSASQTYNEFGSTPESFVAPVPTDLGSEWTFLGYTISFSLSEPGHVEINGEWNTLAATSGTLSTSSLSPAYFYGMYSGPLGGPYSYSGTTLQTITVTGNWRKPQTSTDTINTEVEFTSVSVTLSGANVLAEGTVNYSAIQ